jgi:hypothetical protein
MNYGKAAYPLRESSLPVEYILNRMWLIIGSYSVISGGIDFLARGMYTFLNVVYAIDLPTLVGFLLYDSSTLKKMRSPE